MKFAQKLIGDEDERAVSPVIGVILMVAITVILAAVIAAFVLDLGQSQSAPVNSAISVDVESEAPNDPEVLISVTDAGNAEEFELRGPSAAFVDGNVELTLEGTGDTERIDADELTNFDGSDEDTTTETFDLSVVGISGDDETTATTFTIELNVEDPEA